MEGREEIIRSNSGGGITVVGSDAPSDFHIAPRQENPTQSPKSNPNPNPSPNPNLVGSGEPVKKKRGRPRKYGPDGAVVALSPKPISSAAPPQPQPQPQPHVIDFSAGKRGKVKPVSSFLKTKYEVDSSGGGEWAPCSVGANFTPHIINVNSGEDITMKIISFSQQGPRAICILSANGVISSVTLRQPDSSGGTLTYEGRFEILSLSGSFMPNDVGGTRSRSGGMSVSLASPDGRVVGGGVAGLLVAAGPVQVVIGSFLAGNQHDQNPKKQKQDFMSTPQPTAAVPISTATEPRTVVSSSSSLPTATWSSLPPDSRNKPSDINIPLT